MPTELQLDKVAETALQSFDEDRVVAALELYSRYLHFRPDDVEATYYYGDCLRILGRNAEAEKEFLKVLYSKSKHSREDVQCRLAMLYHDWGMFERSEQHWKTASEKRGAPGWAWIMRGANLAKMGNIEEAEICFRKSIGLEESNPDEAYLNLGCVLRAQQRYAEAKDAFQKSLEITPDYAEAIAGLKSLEGIDAAMNLQSFEG